MDISHRVYMIQLIEEHIEEKPTVLFHLSSHQEQEKIYLSKQKQ